MDSLLKREAFSQQLRSKARKQTLDRTRKAYDLGNELEWYLKQQVDTEPA
jgi:hypothetical protein